MVSSSVECLAVAADLGKLPTSNPTVCIPINPINPISLINPISPTNPTSSINPVSGGPETTEKPAEFSPGPWLQALVAALEEHFVVKAPVRPGGPSAARKVLYNIIEYHRI